MQKDTFADVLSRTIYQVIAGSKLGSLKHADEFGRIRYRGTG
jgi:hypothetical protein